MLWVAGSLGVFPDGRTYALAFGAFFGFAELIPYVGPAIGATPPMVVALFSDNPVDALWLAIMFTVLQQIEGHVVAPTVFSQALRINPLLVIFALLIGGRLYGFAGAFLALPLAAVAARERRLLPRAPRARAVARRRPPPSCGRARAGPPPTRDLPPPARRCPECGTPAERRGRRYCTRVRHRARRRRRGGRRHLRRALVDSLGRDGGVTDRCTRGAASGRAREGLRRPPRAPGRLLRRGRGRADRDHRAERRRQDDAAPDPRRLARAARRAPSRSTAARSAGCRSSRRSTRSSRCARTCACSRGSRRSPTSTRRSRGCSTRPGSATARTTRSGPCRAATSSG